MMLQAAARSRSAQRGEPLWGWSWYRTEASHTPASRCPEQEPEVLGPPSAQTAWVRQGVSWSDLWGPDTCHGTTASRERCSPQPGTLQGAQDTSNR